MTPPQEKHPKADKRSQFRDDDVGKTAFAARILFDQGNPNKKETTTICSTCTSRTLYST